MDKIKIYLKEYKFLIVVLFATFIAYLPSINGDFLHWDDDTYILNNSTLTSLSIENLKHIFFDFYYGLYNPLTNLSWAVDYSLNGLNPFLFHLNNIILHLINIVLVYILFKKHIIKNENIAIITASLFAIAPIHVESVAWITERKDVLYTAFYLLSIILYQKYLIDKKYKYIFLSFLVFVFSILSKGMAASLPILLLVLDYYNGRRLLNFKVIIEKIPFFAVSLLMGILNIMAQRDFYGVRKDVFSISEQLAFSSYSFVQYIIKSIFPYNLSAFYPYPSTDSSIPFIYWLFLIPVFLIVGLFVYSIIKHKKNIVLGISFFVLNIIFVLQLFLHNTEAIISERYAYLSSIGIYLLIALLIETAREKKWNYNFVKYSFLFYLAIMTFLSFNRSKIWSNDLSLFLDAYKKYPNSFIITNNIGNSYLRSNDLDNAKDFFNKTIKFHPKYAQAYSNLAGILSMQNKPDKALVYYNDAINIKPNNSSFYLNRAKLFLQQKKYDKVIEDCNKAISLKNNYYNAYTVRAITYSYSDSLLKAQEDYNFLQKNCPSEIQYVSIEFNKLANYFSDLGIDYGKKEDFEQAIKYFKKALILNPNHKYARQNIKYARKLLIKKQLQ